MRNDRIIILAVERVLKEYSDEDHILSMGEFRNRIRQEYGLYPDRRTVSSAIETLNEFGYDISTFSENGKGYYLRQRDFEISEIRLLMDAIYSFKGAPSKQCSELIEKIQRNMSRYQRREYRYLKSLKPPFKTKNRQVFLNIELIDEAIKQNKKISFIYNRYDFSLTLQPTKTRAFEVDPYLMISANERYYLIANHSYYNNISHYRLDRMTEVRILDTDCKQIPKEIDLNEYLESMSKVYFGEEERVTFRCKKTILDDVIDRFGNNIMPYNITDETFDFSIKLVDKAAIFFALEYLSRCEILSPESARERMRRYIGSGVKKYMR